MFSLVATRPIKRIEDLKEHAIQAAIENLGGATDAKVDLSTVADFSLLREVIKASRR
jgi:hypothetical protein